MGKAQDVVWNLKYVNVMLYLNSNQPCLNSCGWDMKFWIHDPGYNVVTRDELFKS